MSNRKARRAAGAREKDVQSIPLNYPDQDRTPSVKTLYQIAAEKQAELFKDQPLDVEPDIITVNPGRDGSISINNGSNTEDPSMVYLLTVFLYSITLTMVHFTFDVLVHQQYRQEIGWDLIAYKTMTAFPVLFILLCIFHGRASAWYMQIVFTIGGAAAGCYIVRASNLYGYYAVMQRAPPVGTLWIWFIFELEAWWATLSVVTVGAFFYWGEYTIR